jgi:hypothetical protein
MDDLVLKKHYNQFWEASFFLVYASAWVRYPFLFIGYYTVSLGEWYQTFQGKGWYRDFGKHYLLTLGHITEKDFVLNIN